MEQQLVASSHRDSGRILHDFDTLRSAASRAQDAAERFQEHITALCTRSRSPIPAFSEPQLCQATETSMSAGSVFQPQNAGSYAYGTSCAVAQGVDTSTCESAANSPAELHSESSKDEGMVIKKNHPIHGPRLIVDLSSPLSGVLTPNMDGEKFLGSTIVCCSARPEASNTTQNSIGDPSLMSDVSRCTPITADDSHVVNVPQQGKGNAPGVKKKGRPLGSKNKKKRVQHQKNPFREMIFDPAPRSGERTRRSKLPIADKPGDYNICRKGAVQNVTLDSAKALSVDISHTQLTDPSKTYPDSQGSQSLPSNTANRALTGPLLKPQQRGRVASAPVSHHPLSPQKLGSSVETSSRANASSLQDSAAISAAFQGEILPIIRQACLPFRQTLSTTSFYAIERQVGILLVIFSYA